MESSQLPEVLRRSDVISYALLAEINHFHSERALDFKLAMQNYLREQTVFYQKVCKLCSAFYVPCCQGIIGCSVAGGCQTSPNDTAAFIQKAREADCCRPEQPAYWSSHLHEVWNYRCTILVPWFLTLKRHVCVLNFKQLQFHSIVQLWFHTAHQEWFQATLFCCEPGSSHVPSTVCYHFCFQQCVSSCLNTILFM